MLDMARAQPLLLAVCICVFFRSAVAKLTIGGDQTDQMLRELTIKAADELRERIRDFKIELDEVADDFRRTNDTCNSVIDQRLGPCMDCMHSNCRSLLSSQCSSTDNVRNVMNRMMSTMRDDWKSEQIVPSLNRADILYFYDLITSISSAIGRSSLNSAITNLGDHGLAIVRAFDGLTQYYVPRHSSQSRPSLYTRLKDGLSKVWKKFTNAFKPRGCVELEMTAFRLCIQESVNLKLKCLPCNQLFDPRTACPHFEESLSQLGRVSERAQALNNHLIGNRNTISFKVQSVVIRETDYNTIRVNGRVELLGSLLEVPLELNTGRYKRYEAVLAKKISDAIAEKVLDNILE